MKILNLSLDKSILNKDSRAAQRIANYGKLVKMYAVIAPAEKNESFTLSKSIKIYGVGGNKFKKFFKIYALAKKLIKEEKYNIVSVQDQYFLALLSLALKRKFKIGLEIQIHGFERFGGIRALIAKFVLKRADSVRVVSQRLKKLLTTKFFVKENKITVVPIFFEAKRIAKNKLKKEENKKIIFLTIGRLVSVKNIEMQIRAFSKIIKNQKRDSELWIVGDGELRDELEMLARRLEISDKIKFFGYQNNLDKFYSQADVFLLTSNSEGWGLVVIEASSYSLPTIMTDVGLAGEVIKDKENGIIIPVGEQKTLEQKMIELSENKGLRKRLGQAAQKAILKLPNQKETFKLYKKSWEKAKLLSIK